MSRNRLTWIVLPVLLTVLYGCPHKQKPKTTAQDLNVETTSVTPPPSSPAQDIRPPKDSTGQSTDQTEDAMMSQDLQVVNDELKRRGFSPDVYFQYDESSLSDDTRGKLSRNSDLLKTQLRLSIAIEGHCDERGTSEYNLALGERRANAVKGYLGSLGVGAERMKTISYGSERPVCNEHDESCWSQNRRAHMVITGRSNVG
ncbi:MAG: peptidoglycan-associated lipoprotein Pal [Acidobacteriota bacterium]|nr:peptidoglycan-associated lipoprotein Pal [Acidobacteriota bacterium]